MQTKGEERMPSEKEVSISMQFKLWKCRRLRLQMAIDILGMNKIEN